MAKNKATVTAPVKGGKSGKTRTRRGFWDRALQAPKVRSALTELTVDLEAFEKAYNSTRKTRETREVTAAEIAALKAFPEHKSFEKLAAALEVSEMTAMIRYAKAAEAGLI